MKNTTTLLLLSICTLVGCTSQDQITAAVSAGNGPMKNEITLLRRDVDAIADRVVQNRKDIDDQAEVDQKHEDGFEEALVHRGLLNDRVGLTFKSKAAGGGEGVYGPSRTIVEINSLPRFHASGFLSPIESRAEKNMLAHLNRAMTAERDAVNERFDKMEQRTGERFTQVEGRVGSLEGKVESLTQVVTTVGASQAEVLKKVEELLKASKSSTK